MKRLIIGLALLLPVSGFASEVITCETSATSPISEEIVLTGSTVFTIDGKSAEVSIKLVDQTGEVEETNIENCSVKSSRRSFKITCSDEEFEDATGFKNILSAKINKKKMSGKVALNFAYASGTLNCN